MVKVEVEVLLVNSRFSGNENGLTGSSPLEPRRGRPGVLSPSLTEAEEIFSIFDGWLNSFKAFFKF